MDRFNGASAITGSAGSIPFFVSPLLWMKNVVKHVKENIDGIWLGDLSNYTIGLKFCYYVIRESFGDAAGKYDSDFGVHAMQCPRKLKPVQVWHHVIRQDNADGCAILVVETFRLNPIGRAQNSVAVSGEDPST